MGMTRKGGRPSKRAEGAGGGNVRATTKRKRSPSEQVKSSGEGKKAIQKLSNQLEGLTSHRM